MFTTSSRKRARNALTGMVLIAAALTACGGTVRPLAGSPSYGTPEELIDALRSKGLCEGQMTWSKLPPEMDSLSPPGDEQFGVCDALVVTFFPPSPTNDIVALVSTSACSLGSGAVDPAPIVWGKNFRIGLRKEATSDDEKLRTVADATGGSLTTYAAMVDDVCTQVLEG